MKTRLALFLAVALAIAGFVPVVTSAPARADIQTIQANGSITPSTPGGASAVLNLSGQASCSVAIEATTTSAISVSPQASSDNTSSWVIASAIGGGAISGVGTYTGAITNAGLTNFHIVAAGVSGAGAHLDYVITCSPAPSTNVSISGIGPVTFATSQPVFLPDAFNGGLGQTIGSGNGFIGVGCGVTLTGTIISGGFDPLLCNSAGALITTGAISGPGPNSSVNIAGRYQTYPLSLSLNSLSELLLTATGAAVVHLDNATAPVSVNPTATATPLLLNASQQLVTALLGAGGLQADVTAPGTGGTVGALAVQPATGGLNFPVNLTQVGGSSLGAGTAAGSSASGNILGVQGVTGAVPVAGNVTQMASTALTTISSGGSGSSATVPFFASATFFRDAAGSERAAGMVPFNAGPLLSTPAGMGTPVAIAAASAGPNVIKNAAGVLTRVLITTAGTTGTDTFYNNASACSGTILAVIPGTTAVATAVAGTSPMVIDMFAPTGITECGGTGSAAITVEFN